MGLLDPPVVIPVGHWAQLTSRLRLASEDAVWLNLSDSTGVPQGTVASGADQRWVFRSAQWLAAQFPAWTVLHRLWNDTNQSYDAATTIQTGTNGRTLTVYNASVSGMGAAYFTAARLALMAPVQPHVVSVSLGHNDTQTGAAYRPGHYAVTRMVEDWFPGAGVVMIAQNPRTDSGAVNGLSRDQAVIDLAGSEGYGLVNVTQAFLDTADWANTLLLPDGLHPSAAGSARWTQLVTQQMQRSLLTIPRSPTRRAHRLQVPLESFVATPGEAPVFGAAGGSVPFPAWTFDPATQQSICTTIDIPDWWQAVNIYLHMAYATGSGYTAGNSGVRWAIGSSRHAGPSGVLPWASPVANVAAVIGAPNALSDVTGIIGASNNGAWGSVLGRITSGLSLVGRPLTLRVRRVAADATDTLAETAYLRGVYVERAS